MGLGLYGFSGYMGSFWLVPNEMGFLIIKVSGYKGWYSGYMVIFEAVEAGFEAVEANFEALEIGYTLRSPLEGSSRRPRQSTSRDRQRVWCWQTRPHLSSHFPDMSRCLYTDRLRFFRLYGAFLEDKTASHISGTHCSCLCWLIGCLEILKYSGPCIPY